MRRGFHGRQGQDVGVGGRGRVGGEGAEERVEAVDRFYL